MAELVTKIKEWLDTLPYDAEIGVDDGGLMLVVVADPDAPHASDCPHADGDDVECTCWKSAYYEIGGVPA